MWKIECIACRLCKTTNQFTSYWVINVAVKVRTVRSFEIFTARDGIEHLAWEKSETKIEESLSASNSTSLQEFITCSTYHILKHVIQNFIELFQAHLNKTWSENRCPLKTAALYSYWKAVCQETVSEDLPKSIIRPFQLNCTIQYRQDIH